MNGGSHFWRFPCRTSRRSRNCSWSCRWPSKTSAAAPAAREAWRAWRRTAPSMRSASASDGTRSATPRSRWGTIVPFRTSFVSWPKRNCDRDASLSRLGSITKPRCRRQLGRETEYILSMPLLSLVVISRGATDDYRIQPHQFYCRGYGQIGAVLDRDAGLQGSIPITASGRLAGGGHRHRRCFSHGGTSLRSWAPCRICSICAWCNRWQATATGCDGGGAD